MPEIEKFARWARRLDTEATSWSEEQQRARAAASPPGGGGTGVASEIRAGAAAFQDSFRYLNRKPSLARTGFRIGLLVIGCWLVLLGLAMCLLVVVMFVSPGGIGMEKLVGPIVGFFALLAFGAGGGCIYVSSLMNRGPGPSN